MSGSILRLPDYQLQQGTVRPDVELLGLHWIVDLFTDGEWLKKPVRSDVIHQHPVLHTRAACNALVGNDPAQAAAPNGYSFRPTAGWYGRQRGLLKVPRCVIYRHDNSEDIFEPGEALQEIEEDLEARQVEAYAFPASAAFDELGSDFQHFLLEPFPLEEIEYEIAPESGTIYPSRTVDPTQWVGGDVLAIVLVVFGYTLGGSFSLESVIDEEVAKLAPCIDRFRRYQMSVFRFNGANIDIIFPAVPASFNYLKAAVEAADLPVVVHDPFGNIDDIIPAIQADVLDFFDVVQ